MRVYTLLYCTDKGRRCQLSAYNKMLYSGGGYCRIFQNYYQFFFKAVSHRFPADSGYSVQLNGKSSPTYYLSR